MAIALTGGPIISTTFPGTSAADIATGIVSALSRVGWRMTPITGGYAMTAVSPQAGTISLTVNVTGSGTSAGVQFSSISGAGIVHPLRPATGRTYQIVAGPCQFFVSVPGLNGDPNGSIICGGIPFLPPNSVGSGESGCTGIGAATECWWAMGDWYGNPFLISQTPRTSLNWAPTAPNPGCEAVFNGLYTPGANDHGTIQIVSMAHSYRSSPGSSGSRIRYPDESPLLFDPLIAWGATSTSQLKIRGQVWDSIVVSDAHPMDDTSTTFVNTTLDSRFEWVNYTDNYIWGSLYLIRNPTTISGGLNFVY